MAEPKPIRGVRDVRSTKGRPTAAKPAAIVPASENSSFRRQSLLSVLIVFFIVFGLLLHFIAPAGNAVLLYVSIITCLVSYSWDFAL